MVVAEGPAEPGWSGSQGQITGVGGEQDAGAVPAAALARRVN
nr:hypothetical protein [Streptomyces clavuligerus]